MSLASKAWAYLHTLPMSVPSRMALWLGLGCMVAGYYRNQPAFSIVGGILIGIGVALWLLFRPKGGGIRGLIGLKPKKVDPNAKPSKVMAFIHRLTPKFIPNINEKKRLAREAVERAQTDPRLQAKRRPKDH